LGVEERCEEEEEEDSDVSWGVHCLVCL
jgi:hypothetical protein